MKYFRGFAASALGMLLFMLLVSPPLFAAEAADADPAASFMGLIFRWLNIFLVLGGIGYLLKKHGGAFFEANAKAIAASIHQAAAVKAEADGELREVEAKLARLDQDVAELREDARRDSLAEAERLKASGQAEIEKIMQAARAELDAAQRAAKQELRALAAAMAVDRAGALVHSRMNQEIRGKLFHAFLGELGRSAN